MNILVIRTDNIGDLVCTTPLLSALRQRYPDAWIGVLTNSYSAPVLHGNPDINEVLVYRKAKHLEAGESVLGAHWTRLKLIFGLRRKGMDLAVLAAPKYQASAARFAAWVAAKRVVGGNDVPDVPHEVQKVYLGLAASLGLPEVIPACRVIAEQASVEALRAKLPVKWAGKCIVGLHISARKPSQRWSLESFVTVAKELIAQDKCVLLFWSPGASDDVRHPGDDAKAEAILAAVASDSLHAMPTSKLEELIAGIALCDVMVQADGGAMHVAAGLGKPIVCLFGDSDAERWRPWAVPYVLLQKPSWNVSDISEREVLAALPGLDCRR